MRRITINQKGYNIPELGFKQMREMEDKGFNIIDIVPNMKVFSIAAAFTAVIADCDALEADRLIEQHCLGGGNVLDIVEAFKEAMEQSSFFKSMLDAAKTEKKAQNQQKKEN